MSIKLLFQSSTKLLTGLITVCLLLFLPAGSIHYWNAWLFLSVLFIPMLLAGLILLLKSPDLLAKRLNTRENERAQKQVIILSFILFVVGFIISALDFRYNWSKLPDWVSIAAAIIFLISYGLYAEVMRENVYLSRTVEVQDGQKVIDTGLYRIVRHPMYFTTVFLFLSIPLILGSTYAFIIFFIYPFLLTKRIRNEETVLKEGLTGYTEYTKKVRYRLIPFIW
ncbi:methyltransferase family protein [Kineothrix sp. MB12-C1]|uniref:methyltransferase family protein n=1 Tax=Kineothrix sp. MB12-C1 TaxID=3070215 RepID=UPI0027D22BC6|nr:isoprenylcysteine carboxylmethyltransferase family protein [Kineothrix sp. MB12-C1]WMC91180.1 isoprenylcysteine carboxylmethyltransferase family protein [Kineothrix sp. MB12-C1]